MPLSAIAYHVLQLIRKNARQPPVRRRAAAYGMSLAASQAAGTNAFYEDAIAVLNQLAQAKAGIDVSAWHDLSVAEVTAGILHAAPQYVDRQTIPCTEWPLPAEVVEIVLMKAKEYARV